MEWVALPVISDVDKEVLKLILDALSKSAVMGGFFVNTAIRKASQAADFVDAINAKDALPAGASADQVAAAEQNQMVAFRNFVMVTN